MKSTYFRASFNDERDALSLMRFKNEARRAAGNRAAFAVVNGPDEKFSVVDLRTAIELGGGYKF